jgi:hypothetical protein
VQVLTVSPAHSIPASRYVSRASLSRAPKYGKRQQLPPLDRIRLDTLRIDQLRLAIRANLVSFASPVPTFERHDRPDLQWKLVQLYFVMGWSCEAIAERYGLIHQRVRQILKTWKQRAVEMGFIQYIPPADYLLMAPSLKRDPFPVPGFLASAPLPPPPPTANIVSVSS